MFQSLIVVIQVEAFKGGKYTKRAYISTEKCVLVHFNSNLPHIYGRTQETLRI